MPDFSALKDIPGAIWALLGVVFSSIVTLWLERRRAKSDKKKLDNDNIAAIYAAIKDEQAELVSSLFKHVDELNERCDQLKTEVTELRKALRDSEVANQISLRKIAELELALMKNEKNNDESKN